MSAAGSRQAQQAQALGLDDRVQLVFTGVGKILSRYTTGKLPKAFKIIPNLKNWEEVRFTTSMGIWTASSESARCHLACWNMWKSCLHWRPWAAVLRCCSRYKGRRLAMLCTPVCAELIALWLRARQAVGSISTMLYSVH